MELESFNIQFEHIQGQNNVLDTQQTPEEKGYVFGYAVFEELLKVKTFETNEVIASDKEIKNDPDLQDALLCIDNPIAPECLKCPQEQDATIETLKHKLEYNKLDKEYYSTDKHGLLTRKVVEGGHKFHAIYLPAVLVLQIFHAAHDELGHNGFQRTYATLKRVFYWKGMKENIRDHCKMCATQVRECSRGRSFALHLQSSFACSSGCA